AFPETVVGIFIHQVLDIKLFKVPSAFPDVFPPFQHNRPFTELYTAQGGKEACRPGAYDEDLLRMLHIAVFRGSHRLFLIILPDEDQHLQVDLYASLAGVDASFKDLHMANLLQGDPGMTGKEMSQGSGIARSLRGYLDGKFF